MPLYHGISRRQDIRAGHRDIARFAVVEEAGVGGADAGRHLGSDILAVQMTDTTAVLPSEGGGIGAGLGQAATLRQRADIRPGRRGQPVDFVLALDQRAIWW